MCCAASAVSRRRCRKHGCWSPCQMRQAAQAIAQCWSWAAAHRGVESQLVPLPQQLHSACCSGSHHQVCWDLLLSQHNTPAAACGPAIAGDGSGGSIPAAIAAGAAICVCWPAAGAGALAGLRALPGLLGCSFGGAQGPHNDRASGVAHCTRAHAMNMRHCRSATCCRAACTGQLGTGYACIPLRWLAAAATTMRGRPLAGTTVLASSMLLVV